MSRDSFMQPEILAKGSHWAVECYHGETHYVPADVVPVPEQFKPGAAFAPGNSRAEDEVFLILAAQLRDYLPAEAERIEVTPPGYLGRYSAPGYMDCTDWSFDTNLSSLRRTLRDYYGED